MKKLTPRQFAWLALAASPLFAQTPPPAAEVPAPAPEAAPAAPASGAPVEAAPVAAPAVAASSELTALPAPAAAPAAEAVAEKPKDTLSVDFPDEDIRNILRNVADLFELNIVMPDTLQGRTSIKLRDVTWRQIFSLVLEPQGYTYLEDKNIVKIVSRSMLAQERAALAQEPFVTDTIGLKNTPAASIETVLRPMLSAAVAERVQDGVLITPASPAGALVVNALANELIVTDRPAVVKKMVEIAQRLDVEPRQVVIETRFVETSVRKADAMGLNWTAAGGVTAGALQNAVSSGGNAISYPGVSSPNSGASGFSYSTALLSNAQLSSTLQFLSESGDSKIASNPTIVAVNGSKSSVRIGEDLQTVTATQQVTASGQPGQVTFSPGERIFSGVEINITPQITGSRLVALNIETEKSEARAVVFGEGANEQTFYDRIIRRGQLNLILADGQTAAISGLTDRTENLEKTKVPVLGDIPGLGRLFRSKSKDVRDRNLLIFITANILEPSKTTYENFSTADQREKLGVTTRDIRGVNYQPGAEEKAAFEAAQARREAGQNQKILESVTPPRPKK